HEYPGPLTTLLAYGLAATVGASRIEARQHFPSDVLVGSALGWFVAEHVYREHHDPALEGGAWEWPGRHPGEGREWDVQNMGSPYVPLDSWVYPAFDRLAALGWIDSEILGLKPWTRSECARLIAEADGRFLEAGAAERSAVELYSALAGEFSRETLLASGGSNRAARLESVYVRATEIVGPPLADAYHFGETITNDFGRPFEQGFNNVLGLSGWASDGPFTVYVRGEYEHAPAAPGYSPAIEQLIATLDENPVLPATRMDGVNRLRVLDAYVAMNLEDWQLSFGNESLWWGPGEGGPLLLGDNAAPVTMFRVDRVAPFHLPWILRYLGPARASAFIGGLAGHNFPPGPLMHGEKISFRVTSNLELGFSRTAVFAGAGRPLTLQSFWETYTSAVSSESPNYTARINPGKRSGGFDFSYRLPFLRNWLTVYADSIADDDPSPLSAPLRAGISPGIYLARVPGVPKLDLRVEAAYTNVPSSGAQPGKYIYFDDHYHDLYTNRGVLMGNWIGRDGEGVEAWSRYWFGAQRWIAASYRHAKVDAAFIPGGGTLNDFGVQSDYLLRRDLAATAGLQFERWLFPVLAARAQNNVAVSIGFTYWPHHEGAS
ncbi:MAG: capsule assembly Wzi family protein, partial [Candidatus Acidiferrales bacterium]